MLQELADVELMLSLSVGEQRSLPEELPGISSVEVYNPCSSALSHCPPAKCIKRLRFEVVGFTPAVFSAAFPPSFQKRCGHLIGLWHGPGHARAAGSTGSFAVVVKSSAPQGGGNLHQAGSRLSSFEPSA